MTGQIANRFIYKGKSFHLYQEFFGTHSTCEPFVPSQQGLKPVGACSVCWRGYVTEYSLNPNNHLILKNLYLSLYEDTKTWKFVNGKPINNVSPNSSRELNYISFNNYYEGVDLPIAYTGSMSIAHGWLEDLFWIDRSLFALSGFHPLWRAKEAYELLFDDGMLSSVKDLSTDMENFRKAFDDQKLKLGIGDDAENFDIPSFLLKQEREEDE